MELNGLQHLLAEAKQSHLVQFWDELNEEEKMKLEAELRTIDLQKVNQDFKRSKGICFSRLRLYFQCLFPCLIVCPSIHP